MISGYSTEKSILARIFNDAWKETEIAWPGKVFEKPDSNSVSWVEFNILNGAPSQISVGSPGSNLFRHPGIIYILFMVPVEKGEEELLRLSDIATEIFRNNSSIPGVEFNVPIFNKQGVIDGYFQANLSVPFNRDSLL